MRLISLVTLLLLDFVMFGQNNIKHSIEVSSQLRREKQADYTAPYGTSFLQNNLQLYGTSIGIDAGYKHFLKGSWFVKSSIGFYKFSIDEIINNRVPARPVDPISSRPISYQPDSLPFGYATDKYHYNNLSLGFAVGKDFLFDNNFFLTTDLSFTYLATFSQYYKVGQGYRTTNNKTLGYLFDYKVGVIKNLKAFYLITYLVIPVYKNWAKDTVFLEEPTDNINNWFGGYGLLFTAGKFLK